VLDVQTAMLFFESCCRGFPCGWKNLSQRNDHRAPHMAQQPAEKTCKPPSLSDIVSK